MADIFNYLMLNLLTKQVQERRKYFSSGKGKLKLITVPKCIIENVVKKLRAHEKYLVVNLDFDPIETASKLIEDKYIEKLRNYIYESPGVKYTFIRKFINFYLNTMNDVNIKKIICITSDPSLFNFTKLKKKRIYCYANPNFISNLDEKQKKELETYNSDIINESNIIKFDDVNSLVLCYVKKI